MTESDTFLRTRSTEEEKRAHRRAQEEEKIKTAMIHATIQGGQAVLLLPWKKVDWSNGFAFNR
jgi:hypothetical protein